MDNSFKNSKILNALHVKFDSKDFEKNFLENEKIFQVLGIRNVCTNFDESLMGSKIFKFFKINLAKEDLDKSLKNHKIFKAILLPCSEFKNNEELIFEFKRIVFYLLKEFGLVANDALHLEFIKKYFSSKNLINNIYFILEQLIEEGFLEKHSKKIMLTEKGYNEINNLTF